MGIFLKHGYNVKPPRWGSPADVRYAIKINAEKIYDVDPNSIVLAMPLFWGLPLLDYSGKNNHGTNHGATYKDGSLLFDGVDDYVEFNQDISLEFGTGNFSIHFKFKTSDKSTNGMVSYGDRSDGAGWTAVIGANGNAKFLIDDGTTQIISEDATDWADGSLHDYSVSVNKSGNQVIFIDGREVKADSVVAVGNIDNNDHDKIQVGRYIY
ncbi:MAG: hypothetical protein IMY74_02725, partial [Bacteroidetes bacterium]|nr:hypothetical protein [Bacteroidota bacterium]